MISLMQLLNEELDESKASEEAKRQGLEYFGFGRYGKDGKVTHKSVGGKLQAVKGNASSRSSQAAIGGDRSNVNLSRRRPSGANTRGPSRNALASMQYDIKTAFGDTDVYHFHATGKSSKFDRDELRYGKSVLRDIDKEMKKVALAAKKYIASLKVMRAGMVKNLREK